MSEIVSLSALAEQINSEHRQCEESLRKTLNHAYRCGVLLLQAKENVPHGQWGKWLETNCIVGPRMSQNYMKIAVNYSPETLPGGSIREAIAALAGPKTKHVAVLDKSETVIHIARMETVLSRAINFYSEIKGVHIVLSRLVPWMSKDQYESFWQDIRAYGLQNPIILTSEGMLIDGRMRLIACYETGVPARFDVFNPSDPIQYEMTVNIYRKNMTDQERLDSAVTDN